LETFSSLDSCYKIINNDCENREFGEGSFGRKVERMQIKQLNFFKPRTLRHVTCAVLSCQWYAFLVKSNLGIGVISFYVGLYVNVNWV
jgi:hypothetical protein